MSKVVRIGIKNRPDENGIIYASPNTYYLRSDVQAVLESEYYKDQIESGTLFIVGDRDFLNTVENLSTINIEEIIGRVLCINLDEYYIEVELVDTPCGKYVQALLKYINIDQFRVLYGFLGKREDKRFIPYRLVRLGIDVLHSNGKYGSIYNI